MRHRFSVKKALRKLPKVKPLPASVLQQPEVQVVPVNVNSRFLHVSINAKAPTFRPGPCAAEAEPSGLMLVLYQISQPPCVGILANGKKSALLSFPCLPKLNGRDRSLPLGEGIPPRAGDSSIAAFVSANYIKTVPLTARGDAREFSIAPFTPYSLHLSRRFPPIPQPSRISPPHLCRTFRRNSAEFRQPTFDVPTVEYTPISTIRASGS